MKRGGVPVALGVFIKVSVAMGETESEGKEVGKLDAVDVQTSEGVRDTT